MKRSDIAAIEAQFDVTLPGEYVSLLLAYSKDLPELVSGLELYNQQWELVSDNESVRKGPLWGVTWPAHYFVIGSDGAGNYFCIDTKHTAPPILFFDHDDRTFRQEAPSLAEWLPQLRELHS